MTMALPATRSEFQNRDDEIGEYLSLLSGPSPDRRKRCHRRHLGVGLDPGSVGAFDGCRWPTATQNKERERCVGPGSCIETSAAA
jgi:hypothetical protein